MSFKQCQFLPNWTPVLSKTYESLLKCLSDSVNFYKI